MKGINRLDPQQAQEPSLIYQPLFCHSSHPTKNMPPHPKAIASYHGRTFQLIGAATFRSFRCLWMLEELGIPYQHIPAMPQGKAIRASNPLGKVPALIERSSSDQQMYFSMYESAAINTYLGDLVRTIDGSSSTDLIPPVGTPLRGLYEQTISCIGCELDSQGLWIHRKHESLGQHFGFIPEAVQHAKQQFERVNTVLAQQVQSNPDQYLVGSNFTAADILYVHCLGWSKSIGWDDQWKDDEVLCEYFAKCTKRPAYQKVHAIRKEEAELMKRNAKL